MLKLQADLSTKEQPPDWMFRVPWLLAKHIKKVIAERPGASSDDEDGDADPDWDNEDRWERADPEATKHWR